MSRNYRGEALREVDILRTAERLIQSRGLQAQYDAVIRASERKALGDDAGAATWVRVYETVGELRNAERPR